MPNHDISARCVRVTFVPINPKVTATGRMTRNSSGMNHSALDGNNAGATAADDAAVATDKQALLAQVKEFDAGSDHVVFTDSSFRIPTIYMNDWPDRYIHTTGDLPENIDATKLERAGFIGAASAWFLANLTAEDLPALAALLERQGLRRTASSALKMPRDGVVEGTGAACTAASRARAAAMTTAQAVSIRRVSHRSKS